MELAKYDFEQLSTHWPYYLRLFGYVKETNFKDVLAKQADYLMLEFKDCSLNTVYDRDAELRYLMSQTLNYSQLGYTQWSQELQYLPIDDFKITGRLESDDDTLQTPNQLTVSQFYDRFNDPEQADQYLKNSIVTATYCVRPRQVDPFADEIMLGQVTDFTIAQLPKGAN